MNFSIIGGDARSVALIRLLEEAGHQIYVYGFTTHIFSKSIIVCSCIEEAVQKSSIVIGPVPCSQDQVTLFAPFHQGDPIELDILFSLLSDHQTFMAGQLTIAMQKKINPLVYTVDLLEREELAVWNAIPTAEGAIQIAMEEQPITIHHSCSLVLGFGRCGKILSHMLKGLGANVSVAVRNSKDAAYISAYGYQPIILQDLKREIHRFQFIYNTIPHMILDHRLLLYVNKDCLIIDLASKPGGVDYEAAEKLGLNAMLCLSLPGKVAPTTAGWIIKETVLNICEEMRGDK